MNEIEAIDKLRINLNENLQTFLTHSERVIFSDHMIVVSKNEKQSRKNIILTNTRIVLVNEFRGILFRLFGVRLI